MSCFSNLPFFAAAVCTNAATVASAFVPHIGGCCRLAAAATLGRYASATVTAVAAASAVVAAALFGAAVAATATLRGEVPPDLMVVLLAEVSAHPSLSVQPKTFLLSIRLSRLRVMPAWFVDYFVLVFTREMLAAAATGAESAFAASTGAAAFSVYSSWLYYSVPRASNCSRGTTKYGKERPTSGRPRQGCICCDCCCHRYCYTSSSALSLEIATPQTI